MSFSSYSIQYNHANGKEKPVYKENSPTACADARRRGGLLGTAAPLAARPSPQRLEQCLSLLEVRRLKALGEPAVNGRLQRVDLRALPLLLPQAGQAHGGPQFPGLGLLA